MYPLDLTVKLVNFFEKPKKCRRHGFKKLTKSKTILEDIMKYYLVFFTITSLVNRDEIKKYPFVKKLGHKLSIF